jgi:hypothetical protein
LIPTSDLFPALIEGANKQEQDRPHPEGSNEGDGGSDLGMPPENDEGA